jgi:lipopolysaccharide export system protein LptC
VYPPEPRTIVALTLLAAAAAGSSLLLLDTGPEKKRLAPPELSLAFFLNKAELTGTGKNGEIVYQVWTDKAAQSTQDASISMERVRMVYGPPDRIPWKLRADTGNIPADARVIHLQGNVVATAGDDVQKRVVIRTEQMDIDPATREASTDREVAIDYNGRILNALGMRANLDSNQLQLLADVNGTFLP